MRMLRPVLGMKKSSAWVTLRLAVRNAAERAGARRIESGLDRVFGVKTPSVCPA
jgi:hypothetical protein